MSYTVTYFEMRGRGEYVRMILAAAGESFVDKRVKKEEWMGLKDSMPWGQMPILETPDGKVLSQTLAICRYLGRKYDLVGDNEWEAAKCDEYADAMVDLFAEWVKFQFQPDQALAAEAKKAFLDTHMPKYFSKFEALAAKHGNKDGWLVGKRMTWGDIFVGESLAKLEDTLEPNVLDNYPNLKKLKAAVYAHPALQKHLKERKVETL